MTQPWWHYWWDVVVLAQIQAFFSIVGALLAVVAVLYAWRVARRQFKLADEQGKIIDRQLAILHEQRDLLGTHREIFLRLEESEKRQERFLETQAGIAETQHQILQEQLARKPDLMLLLRGYNTQDVGPVGGGAPVQRVSIFSLAVRNNGNKQAKRVSWQIFMKDDTRFHVEQLPEGFSPAVYEYEEQRVFRGNGNLDEPVFPKGVTDLGNIIVTSAPGRDVPRPVLLWTMNCSAGRFPPEGKAELVLDKVGFEHLLKDKTP